ncbi:MAG TPA: pyroglutamyl-peptidase I [Candidatus Baltobacteraceae bacterium]
MAKHVLITGFEPFGGEKVNPSELAARSLEGRIIAGRPMAVRVLPVETRNIAERLQRAVSEESPDIVICMGQAGGRTAIAMERVAVNVLDFTQPDNVGVMRKNDAIVRGGPDARLSPMPFAEIVQAWTDNGIPGYVSNSAGTYICNQALYEILGIAETATPPIVAGFVHLPYLPAQAAVLGADGTPSMAFEIVKRAMEIVIETVVPWVEQRTPDRGSARAASKGPQLWIPRGVKEVER